MEDRHILLAAADKNIISIFIQLSAEGRRPLTCISAACLQGLAAFLKAIGYLIPLMDAEYANYYTREVMLILIREFQSPDEEMKKIVLKVTWSFCIPL